MTSPYQTIYRALRQIRETFHREGRISDSNAKLDETVKLLAIHYGHLKGLVDKRQFSTLRDQRTFRVEALNDLFECLANAAVFRRPGMGSIFGPTPSTVFEPGDEPIAFELFSAAGRALEMHVSVHTQLDFLNEAFGHFVRDSFRSHIEDAQYMTPPEVVTFMVDLAMELIDHTEQEPSQDMLLADPSCGVGSFLTAWRAAYAAAYGGKGASKLQCIGQDKADRMVRLSALNLIFSDSATDCVFMGNTIKDQSPLSRFDGQVDLILTNPPFGARFVIEDLRRECRNSTPFIARKLSATRTVSSELLFLDRYLTLLKPGGICLAIVPDSVVSSRGTPAVVRQHLARNAELIGVVELPAVTFAQAGTRTKTSILAFRKNGMPRKSYPVFFAEVRDLGFQVAKRKGVAIKKTKGINQLPQVAECFMASSRQSLETTDLSGVGWRTLNPGAQESWTPRSMLFDRDGLKRRVDFGVICIDELAAMPQKRRAVRHSESTYFISVLHIRGEGILDIPGIRSYKPITPGLPVQPGEVILSRINPRIPRVTVVPDLGRQLLCSSEFEIMCPRRGVSPYLLVYLLLSPFVQGQIRALTAGTSASHSRIKPGKVFEVLVPSRYLSNISGARELVRRYEEACRTLTASIIEIEKVRQTLGLPSGQEGTQCG